MVWLFGERVETTRHERIFGATPLHLTRIWAETTGIWQLPVVLFR